MVDGRFADLAFRRLPLACLAAAAVAGGSLGPGWSARAAAIPWLIALAVVGLAHGATDLAVSRRLCSTTLRVRVWAAYAATMAAVAVASALAPLAVLVLFVLLSAWHFGHAAAEADMRERECPAGTIWAAALARGGWMLGVPLAIWPAATAHTAADLLRLTGQAEHAVTAAAHVTAIRGLGLALLAMATVAAASEWAASARRHDRARCRRRLLSEVGTTAAIGFATDPLFSMGMTFLVWHSWRQIAPLAAALGVSPPTSWGTMRRAVVRVHGAALPLLLPAWSMIGGAWWVLSPAHTARDLALLSIAAYLVVTPAHECLSWSLSHVGWSGQRCQIVLICARPDGSPPFKGEHEKADEVVALEAVVRDRHELEHLDLGKAVEVQGILDIHHIRLQELVSGNPEIAVEDGGRD